MEVTCCLSYNTFFILKETKENILNHLASPAAFMEAVLYNSALLTYAQIILTTIFYYKYYETKKWTWVMI